jgi:hypothetical protein
MIHRKYEDYKAKLSQKLNEKLSNHRNHISQTEKRIRRKLFTKSTGWLSQVDGNEDRECNKKIIKQHLVIIKLLVVIIHDYN